MRKHNKETEKLFNLLLDIQEKTLNSLNQINRNEEIKKLHEDFKLFLKDFKNIEENIEEIKKRDEFIKKLFWIASIVQSGILLIFAVLKFLE